MKAFETAEQPLGAHCRVSLSSWAGAYDQAQGRRCRTLGDLGLEGIQCEQAWRTCSIWVPVGVVRSSGSQTNRVTCHLSCSTAIGQAERGDDNTPGFFDACAPATHWHSLDPVPSPGPGKRKYLCAGAPKGVYSVRLLEAKTEIPVQLAPLSFLIPGGAALQPFFASQGTVSVGNMSWD